MATPSADKHAAFMKRAFQLARRGEGRVEPNPMVGCVLVRGGRIIGEGYHRKFGEPHAEIHALRACKGSPRGATAYVTLEPCCIHGKTPPCTKALIDAGIRHVFASVTDPNPRVAGGGIKRLRAAGIKAEVGLLGETGRALIAPFEKLTRCGRPWVIAKWAQSLDGCIATRSGDSGWISDEHCRAHAHRVRGLLDAIIVGRETALHDDPQLTARVGRPRRIATRIVLDTNLRTPAASQLVQTARDVPTWLIASKQAPARNAQRLEATGCVVHRLARTRHGVSLPGLLDLLGKHQMTNVLVEGGGALLGSFFDQKLVDEIHVYVAPLLIGGRNAVRALAGKGPAKIKDALRLPNTPQPHRLGSGWLIQARIN